MPFKRDSGSRAHAIHTKKTWKVFGAALLVTIFGATVSTALFFYQRYSEAQNNPASFASLDSQVIEKKVGDLLELPRNETPTVATVQDVSAVKDDAFFVNAQNGDVVLAYANAKQAILYRPSAHKIINMTSLYIGEEE